MIYTLSPLQTWFPILQRLKLPLEFLYGNWISLFGLVADCRERSLNQSSIFVDTQELAIETHKINNLRIA